MFYLFHTGLLFYINYNDNINNIFCIIFQDKFEKKLVYSSTLFLSSRDKKIITTTT